MSRYTYTLDRAAVSRDTPRYYGREELELMTTHQLREICRRERLINGLHAPLDKDELVRQILRFRGREEYLLITDPVSGGWERIEELLSTAQMELVSDVVQNCAKLTAYDGISIEPFDRFTIGYRPELEGTNALLVSGGELCAVFNLKACSADPDSLFITKSASLNCKESAVRNYTLYCMDRRQSDLVYRLYREETPVMPEHLRFYTAPVLNFEVRSLLQSRMPLAIDFGSSNTTAGIYLDHAYFEQLHGAPAANLLKQDAINYVVYSDTEHGGAETPLLPTAVAVSGIDGDTVHYAFGHEANRLFHMSYIDEGFCVFYDLKRWAADAERNEELVDRRGHRRFVPRKEMIQAYLKYVIACACQRFKCTFSALHISAPVKQKPLFLRLFREILPEYQIEGESMLDEGVAVLYNKISELIQSKRYEDGRLYRALIIDCGGGTTDLSSCRFRITDRRVAYKIDITTAYENGSTDFGGNNLTFRVMQLLKLELARQLGGTDLPAPAALNRAWGADLFRAVDDNGVGAVYAPLDDAYAKAEAVLPTRFREYEHSDRAAYYAVKNNFYVLFQTAEKIKQAFYSSGALLRIAVASRPVQETATDCLLIDRWKLSVRQNGALQLLKDIPAVYVNSYELNLLLRADIYGIIRQFLEDAYDSGTLQDYSILQLTGQSCKIGLFREALKEFIPGRMITSARRENGDGQEHELKLTCLNGAIQYLKDCKFGYADVQIDHDKAAFPYRVTAFAHTGEEKTLIDGMDKGRDVGFISRNMADLTLKLYLKDTEGRQRYIYHCACDPDTFQSRQPEEIVKTHGGRIRQDDLDDIVDRELKCFLLADETRWGFDVVPVLRRDGQLHLGAERFFHFETDAWLTNFFDGTK